MNTLNSAARVREALSAVGVKGAVRDYPQRVAVKLDDGRRLTISHDFIALANRRNLHYLVRYKAGLEQE